MKFNFLQLAVRLVLSSIPVSWSLMTLVNHKLTSDLRLQSCVEADLFILTVRMICVTKSSLRVLC